MAQHQPVTPRRRPAVPAAADLQIRAAHADREGLDQQVALLAERLGDIIETALPACLGMTVMACM
jgi:hypothetical protein